MKLWKNIIGVIIKIAFTLAEVLIVLTILGIIAAASMVTLKPAEYKAKGMKVAVKKLCMI